MASSTARNSDWNGPEIDRPRGKQGRRHLHIGAWRPPEKDMTRGAAISGTDAQEGWEDRSYRSAMQSRYLFYANGLGRITTDAVRYQVYESLRLDWIVRAIELGPNQYDVDHLAAVVAATNHELREGRYQLLGKAIAGLPFGLLSPHVISAVLRVMSPAKHFIPNWNNVIEDARVNLSQRGLDAQRLLRGLT
jgi:hypothetical protein